MDIFCEYMVKHKRNGRDLLICSAAISAAIVLTAAIILFLFGRLMGLELLVLVGIWFGAVTLVRRTNIEYEYILTNSTLDIDKIMAKKSRKRVMSIDFKTIDACAPADGVSERVSGVKVSDFTGSVSDGRIYYVDFFKSSEKNRVYFQPNAKILQNIKMVNPRQVTVREEDLQ